MMDWAELILKKNMLRKVCLDLDLEFNVVRADFVLERLHGEEQEKISITLPMEDLTPYQLLSNKSGLEDTLRNIFQIETEREDLAPEIQFLEQTDVSLYWDEFEESDVVFCHEDPTDVDEEFLRG